MNDSEVMLFSGFPINNEIGIQGDAKGAEIFNDYANNKALSTFTSVRGSHSQAGSMAFTIVSMDYANKTFTLDDTTGLQEAVDKKLTYSVQLSTKAHGVIYAFKFGKITAIDGNVVTVDSMPSKCEGAVTVEIDPLDNQYGIDFEQNTFQIPELPDVGNRRIGGTAIADGFRCWALRRYSHAWGDTCKALAPGSTAGGKDCEAREIGSTAIGISVVACAEGQAVYGKYNVLNKEPIFIIGNGTSATKRSNALEIYPDGRVVIFDESITNYLKSQKDFNDYIKKLIGDAKPSDDLGVYMVESGKNGIWTYEKWSNGIAKCWGKVSISAPVNIASGNIYTSSTLKAETFPFEFAEVPVVVPMLGGSNIQAWLMTSGVNDEATTTSTGKFKIGRSVKADGGTYIINYDVKGFWKGN